MNFGDLTPSLTYYGLNEEEMQSKTQGAGIIILSLG